ncbi:MAG TPA: hypothetical protein VFT61_08825 [Sphingomicrobium sp.]|nr:hypothetical protein [Sphingomicrobium sp.]
MVDEHFNKLYREGSGELNRAVDSGIRALGAGIMAAFQSLHRIAWDSPWTSADRAKCN